ncbi:hypothetical protein M9H77_13789 [Catharanthus roseus]|uniref:Uncharacterized protein n=1 Tax=Catharanthus roseus TaxID=4058 RepID=A0ACC0BLC5_CATRO|nr:hypothetical protein M9H77_13789 [Catharanthus roseus]
MADGGNPSRYVKLTKDQAPIEDIKPGELNQPIEVHQTPDLKDLVLAVVISCVLLKLVFGKDEGQDGQSSSFRKKYLICFLYEGYIGGIFTVVLYLILTSRV